MDKDYLVLKRASASRSSGEWSDDDYDVLAGGIAVGRILKSAAAPVGMPWLWTPFPVSLQVREKMARSQGYTRMQSLRALRTAEAAMKRLFLIPTLGSSHYAITI
jgi:hypothetical protein